MEENELSPEMETAVRRALDATADVALRDLLAETQAGLTRSLTNRELRDRYDAHWERHVQDLIAGYMNGDPAALSVLRV